MSIYEEPKINLEGLANSFGGRNGIKTHKITDGDNLIRILPPFGTGHNGNVFAEWVLHWGFLDKNGKAKPLVCTKKYEKYCPICEESKMLYDRKAGLVAEYKDAKGDINFKVVPPDVLAKWTQINDIWKMIRPQRHYYYNALDVSGDIGLLKLPSTAREQLHAKIIDALKLMDFNPASLVSGCYFNIKRVKTGAKDWDVKYTVDFVKEFTKDPQGNVVEMIKRSQVSDFVANGFERIAVDIHKLYSIRTALELKQIMKGDTSVFEKEEASRLADMNARREVKGETAPVQTPVNNGYIPGDSKGLTTTPPIITSTCLLPNANQTVVVNLPTPPHAPVITNEPKNAPITDDSNTTDSENFENLKKMLGFGNK